MPSETMMIGVVVERRAAASPWIDHLWVPVAVLPDAPDLAPWTALGPAGSGPGTGDRFYAGAAPLTLHSAETAHYRDNLMSGSPKLWVMLRPTVTTDGAPAITLQAVTADPSEGEGFTEPGTDIVEAVAMPQSVAGALAGFVETHHVERVFVKRKRDRADPEALGRRTVPPIHEDDE